MNSSNHGLCFAGTSCNTGVPSGTGATEIATCSTRGWILQEKRRLCWLVPSPDLSTVREGTAYNFLSFCRLSPLYWSSLWLLTFFISFCVVFFLPVAPLSLDTSMDTFVRRICRNISCARGTRYLHSRLNFISYTCRTHGDELWPMEVTSNTYFAGGFGFSVRPHRLSKGWLRQDVQVLHSAPCPGLVWVAPFLSVVISQGWPSSWICSQTKTSRTDMGA